MDTENRLELMRNSKIARKIGQINEQRDVINKLISVELQALEEKKSFHYYEEGEELGKGDTLYSWLAGMCGRGRRGNKYTVKGKESNANGSVEA